MRLIDADTLIDKLQPNLEIDGKGFISVLNIMKLIDNAPTVELNNDEKWLEGHEKGYKQAIFDMKLMKHTMQDMTGELPYEQ